MQSLPPPVPGFYGAGGLASLLRANEQAYLLLNQSGTGASIAVQLERIKSAFYPFGVSFDIAFSGSPGTFEVDIQTADLDLDSHYVQINSLTSGLNASNVGRVELVSFWAKFVRVKVTTLTNAVNTTVLVTR